MPVSVSFSGYRNLKRLVRDAIAWFVEHRNLNRLVFHVDVKDRRCWHENMDGACTTTSSLSFPREFLIELDNRLDHKQYLITLFHELMHVEQRLRNRHQQRFMPKFTNKWMGEIISGDTSYEDEPWEVEAFAMQEELCNAYLTSKNS